MTPDDMKLAAARAACALVEPGMKLGLGTGSTAAKLVLLLGERVRAERLDVLCVPTSDATREQAVSVGLRVASLDDEPLLDLTIDGADEVDPWLNLIKGGGGALLREKIVALASERMVVIADASKRVRKLGAFPLPIEVIPFGVKSTMLAISDLAEDAGCDGELILRLGAGGLPYMTDGGHMIVDAAFKEIPEPEDLSQALHMIPGVVEHGLFLGIADQAIIGTANGVIIVERPGD